MENQNATKDKIEIRNNEYTIGTTEQGETFLLNFDKESKKEIKIVFSNEAAENISDKIMQTLSQQYINKVLNSLK